MPDKKLKINKIDLDSLAKAPVIIIDTSADFILELNSEVIIKHVSVTDLKGKVIYGSDINGNKFVFIYPARSKDMFLLNIKKQIGESHLLIL
jgi:hypothetical protein